MTNHFDNLSDVPIHVLTIARNFMSNPYIGDAWPSFAAWLLRDIPANGGIRDLSIDQHQKDAIAEVARLIGENDYFLAVDGQPKTKACKRLAAPCRTLQTLAEWSVNFAGDSALNAAESALAAFLNFREQTHPVVAINHAENALCFALHAHSYYAQSLQAQTLWTTCANPSELFSKLERLGREAMEQAGTRMLARLGELLPAL